MSLLRFLGRSLFASLFVEDGYRLITQPDKSLRAVAPTVDRLVPAAKNFLPEDAADRVPEDTKTWARILGGVQILGGLMYATGLGRRLGALLLTLSSLPKVVTAVTESDDKTELFTSLALAGGALVATQDTNGRPSLTWRAKQGSTTAKRKLRKDAQLAKAQLQHSVDQAQMSARRSMRKAKQALN